LVDVEEVGHELADAFRGHDADYIEARVSEARTTQVAYRGRNLESAGQAAAVGGSIRALVKGGWGFISFNDFDHLPDKVTLAVKHARLVGGEKSHFAPVEPVVERVPCTVRENPVMIPLADKKALLDEYVDVIWGNAGIRTSTINYGDGHRRTVFVNSAGSCIQQERCDVTLRVVAVAASDGEVQQAGLSTGGRDGFGAVHGLHGQVDQLAKKAVAMLSAPTVKGGEYTVVLDPVLAGVFVHEAFGHLSEADFVYENDRMKEIMSLGKTFGGPHLNIVDTATLPTLRGSYKYDDEGVPAQKSYLIREGKLVGRLHSRETAARMEEAPTGNARAISYRHPPIVRMTNTYIEPGPATLDDIIGDIAEGVYATNWYGGTTSMEMFTFSAGEAYMIRNGRIAETLRPVVLTGNVFSTLESIDAIGNDLSMNQGGGCGKGAQSPLPVSNGSPHIRIRRCLVGGR